MPAEPELVAELGAERADGHDVHGQVDQHHRQRGGSGQVPEGARAALRNPQVMTPAPSQLTGSHPKESRRHGFGMRAGRRGRQISVAREGLWFDW